MTLALAEWKDILDAVNSDNGDILEQIKAKLKERDKNTYQEWEKKAFDKNYKFCSVTLLHVAAFNGHKEIVEYLIEKGADVKAQNNDGATALHFAAFNGHKEIVECLIEKEADVKAQDNDGATALHFAAEHGYKEIVECLIEKEADVKAQDNDGATALHFAAFNGHKEIVEYLIEKGADVKAQDNDGRTALHLAALNGYKEIVEYLIEKGADVKAQDNYGRTALHYAALNGHKEIVECLIEKEADVKAQENDGVTALHLAAGHGYKEIVEYLIEKGADVKAQDNYGETALHFAAFNGHKEIVEYLIEKGADVKAQDNDGGTALHLAAEHGHKEIVECLIENGANINEKLNCKVREELIGMTPLHLAITKNQAEVIKVLLDHILKLEAAGLYVSQGNLQKKGELINQAQYSYLLDCSKEHKEEVQRLERKNKLLCDFLRESDTNKLINIWKKNEDIRSQFDNKESLKAQYPIYADILINKANEVKKEISLHNSARTSVFSFVATTISVGLFLGIAYFAGAATLTPVVPAITVFIVAAAVGALVGYGVGKFCEKVSEEKQKDPDMSTYAAVKSLLCGVFTTEYSKSQLNA